MLLIVPLVQSTEGRAQVTYRLVNISISALAIIAIFSTATSQCFALLCSISASSCARVLLLGTTSLFPEVNQLDH